MQTLLNRVIDSNHKKSSPASPGAGGDDETVGKMGQVFRESDALADIADIELVDTDEEEDEE